MFSFASFPLREGYLIQEEDGSIWKVREVRKTDTGVEYVCDTKMHLPEGTRIIRHDTGTRVRCDLR